MTDLPKKIDPCPIVESIFEIRFSSSLPEDAIFGILYKQFSKEFPKFDQLPILQLPAQLRSQDPNLRFKPHYKTQKDNFIFQIGPRSFSISNVVEYTGWELFSKKIFSVYKQVKDCEVIEHIERVGLRYINILENINVFENSNFIISLKGSPIIQKTNILTEVISEKGFCKVNVMSNAETIVGDKKIIGSVIDIDSVADIKKFSNINEAVEYSHLKEKELFFNILDDEYMKQLNPSY